MGLSLWDYYPPGWPKCLYCDRPALDGHLTCGLVSCSEAQAREDNLEEWQRRQVLAEHPVFDIGRYFFGHQAPRADSPAAGDDAGDPGLSADGKDGEA